MFDATSTFDEPPDVKEDGPRSSNVIVSLAGSKSVIITLPSSPLTTPPPENVTS